MEKEKINIYNLIWYFFIFSIFGLLIETAYCYMTTNVLESRQGLLYGPFCPIYGCGALAYIMFLNKYKDRKVKLFFAGALLGSIVEYLLSFGMEALYGNRFWDYSYTSYHLNGRISVVYTAFWGILALVVIQCIKPLIDNNVLLKMNNNIKNKIAIIILIFFIIDTILTVWAVKTYTIRAEEQYLINIGEMKEDDKSKEIKLQEILFSNRKMINTFPNIRIKDKQNNEMWARDVLINTKNKM